MAKTCEVSLVMNFENLDGAPFVKDEKTKEQTTSYDVMRMCLAADLPEDTQSGSARAVDIKMRNFDMQSQMVQARKSGSLTVKLSKEEIEHLKPRLAMCWNPLIVGPLFKHLDTALKSLEDQPDAVS